MWRVSSLVLPPEQKCSLTKYHDKLRHYTLDSFSSLDYVHLLGRDYSPPNNKQTTNSDIQYTGGA